MSKFIVVERNIKTGKFFAIVRDDHSVSYETPEYMTRQMAHADARCWMAFHVDIHIIADEDTIYTSHGNSMTGARFKEMVADLTAAIGARELRYIPANDNDRAFHVEIYNEAREEWFFLATVHKA